MKRNVSFGFFQMLPQRSLPNIQRGLWWMMAPLLQIFFGHGPVHPKVQWSESRSHGAMNWMSACLSRGPWFDSSKIQMFFIFIWTYGGRKKAMHIYKQMLSVWTKLSNNRTVSSDFTFLQGTWSQIFFLTFGHSYQNWRWHLLRAWRRH